jgi:hypothetical protein
MRSVYYHEDSGTPFNLLHNATVKILLTEKSDDLRDF